MQGQRPGGNPPFARKIFASDRAYACEEIPRVHKTHAENRVIYVRAPCQHSNWRANTLATAVFYRFLVNNSNFFVIFMPMLPKNMSPTDI